MNDPHRELLFACLVVILAALLLTAILHAAGCSKPSFSYHSDGEGPDHVCGCWPTRGPGDYVEHPSMPEATWGGQRTIHCVVMAPSTPGKADGGMP